MSKLRFVGETEPWAIKSLEDLGSITTGSTPSKKNPKYWNNGIIPWVSVSDFGYKYVYDTEFLISKEGADVSRIVPPNSILVNCIGAIGKMAMTRTHCATNQQINAFTPNLGNDANFSYYAIAKNIHQLDRLTTKSVLSQVNKTSFSSMTIPLPSLPEQEKIGGFLSALDDEIEYQSELVDLLALEYKGYSQRIFSQKLRFKDENGEDYPEWEDKELGEVADSHMGFTPSTKKPEYWTGKNHWLNVSGLGNNKYLDKGNKMISDDAIRGKKVFPAGTLLMSFKLSLGELGITEIPMFTNEAICGFDPHGELLTEYLYYVLDNTDLKKYAQPAVMGYTMNTKSIEKIHIPPPLPPRTRENWRFPVLVIRTN